MPTDLSLDGELWFGRSKFPYTGLLRRKIISESELKRTGLKYMVFDLIDEKLNTERRHAIAKEAVRRARTRCKDRVCPIRWVTQTKIRSREHLCAMLQDATAKKGEGVMLKRPQSQYELKRSNNLLKLKPVRVGEGVVVGYKRGKGGIGSLKIDWGNIFLFASGLNKEEKKMARTLFPLGSRISFFYNDVTNNGVPRYPRIKR